MKTMNDRGSVLSLIAALTLGACATVSNPPNAASNYGIANPGNAYSDYGVVQSIELLKQDDGGIAGSGIGLGTIAGAVVGVSSATRWDPDGATRRRPSSARPAVPMWATNWKLDMSRRQMHTRSLSAWRTGHIKL